MSGMSIEYHNEQTCFHLNDPQSKTDTKYLNFDESTQCLQRLHIGRRRSFLTCTKMTPQGRSFEAETFAHQDLNVEAAEFITKTLG